VLCYRCGSFVQDGSDACSACGQHFDAAARKAGRYRRHTLELDAGGIRPGDVLAGRYEVAGALGTGPLGLVFRVRDRDVDSEVALKVIAPNLLQSPEERADFLNSLKQARKLNHPNLVRVYDAGQIDATATLPARAFFTSQLVDGLTLRRVIQMRKDRGEVFTVQETEPILTQIAQALEYAYRIGPHGDLKPENVIVTSDTLKVSDFGVAAAIPRAPFLSAQRQRKADVYVAPEILSGHGFDQTSDMYALGVMLGEMLAGVVPSSGSQPPELRERQRNIPTVVEALYRRAANPDSQARFATPVEFATELFRVTEVGPEHLAGSRVEITNPGIKGIPSGSDKTRRPQPPRSPSTEIPWADMAGEPSQPENEKPGSQTPSPPKGFDDPAV